jgi:hypothetical protein
MPDPNNVPLMADSRLLFSEKPRVSAAKMGARPSGSTTTSSVTKALKANSCTGRLYLTGTCPFPAPPATPP